MSDYPPAPPVPPYGAYGSQPQTNAPYLQTAYHNPYVQQDDSRRAQTHMASNYDANMSAYGYNNSIPGFSAGSLAPGAPPLPIYQGWNQDAMPLPPYAAPQGNMQYAGYGGNAYQPQQSFVPPQPQTYRQNTQHVSSYDEGELSDGEFDAYGGQHAGGHASADYRSNYFQGNDGTGYMNTAHRAVYPGSQEYSNHHYSSGTGFNNYQRESASYSPYAASTLEAGQEEPWKGHQSKTTYPTVTTTDRPSVTQWAQSKRDLINHSSLSNGTAPKTLEAAKTPLLNPQPVNPIHPVVTSPAWEDEAAITPITEQTSRIGAPNPPNPVAEKGRNVPSPPMAQKPLALPYILPKSVAEARKKAEGAILNLWPCDVRFPDYVEEGLDENVVGRLFDDLGFSRAPKAAAVETKSTFDVLNGKSPENPLVDVSPGPLKVVQRLNAGAGDEARQALGENNGNPLNSSTGTASVIPAKTEPTEKEKKLKMKMEALRRSREERAQKAAAKTNTQPAAAIGTAPEPQAPVPLTTEPVKSSSISPLPAVQSTPEVPPPNESKVPSVVQPRTDPSTIQVQQSSSTAQPAPLPQPIIPGLFLASNSSPMPSLAASSTIGVTLNNPRKRPVAADFDTSTPTPPHKRLFGQSRNDSLVIDVSEEEPESEDEEIAMDLESQADHDSPLPSVGRKSDQRAAALQNLPPLTNFPARKAFLSPVSSAATTPVTNTGTKVPLGHPQVLLQKESEIEQLKKRIAEAEAAKAAKRRAQQTSSGAVTPQLPQVNGTSATNGSGDIASKVAASIEMQHLIGMAEDKVSSDQKKLAETKAAEQEKAAELKRNEAESRRLRREKIATDLPRVDAEVEQSQQKLQQLREEMARIEAAVQKSLDEKKRMAEEMERLGQEAEDQLQEQKDKLEVLTSAGTTSIPDFSQEASLNNGRTNLELATLPTRPLPSTPRPPSTKQASPPATPSPGRSAPPRHDSVALNANPADLPTDQKTMDTAHNETGSASPVEGRRLYISNLVHTITEADLQSFFTGYFIESISIPRPRKDRRTGHAFVDLSTPSEAERAVAELSGKMILDRAVSVQRARKSKHNADVRHPSSDTVTHRSSSGSDQALEAALQEQVRAEAESHKQSDEEMDVEDSHAPDPSQLTPEITPNSVEGSSSIPEVVVRSDDEEVRATQLPDVQSPTINTEMELGEENDDYEPPEATRTVNAPSPIESPPFSPAPPDSVTDFEPFSIGRSGFENLTQSKSEDLPTNGSVPGEDSGEKSNPMQFFTPYESPLKYFRAYRFHPDYAQQVRGGLKSLTYSHKIDPKAEFCRYELAGGVCNDKTCDFQHFKDVVLPDDVLITALGTPEEFPAEQQEKFRAGLKQVLNNLRLKNVRDFDTIAAEVVAHRRTFLGDASKILMLEGTSI